MRSPLSPCSGLCHKGVFFHAGSIIRNRCDNTGAEPLTPRQIAVATASANIFLAQGFARTTMSDIARAGGLSRQGLYLIFPCKDDVFSATIRVMDDSFHSRLAEALDGCRGLSAKLHTFANRWIDEVFVLHRSAPDSRDLDDLGFPAVSTVYDRKIALLRDVIVAEAGPVVNAALLARTTMFAIRGFVAIATDIEDMRGLARAQTDLLIDHILNARPAMQSLTKSST